MSQALLDCLRAKGAPALSCQHSQTARLDVYSLTLEPKVRARRIELLANDIAIALGVRKARVTTGGGVRVEVERAEPVTEKWQPGIGLSVWLGEGVELDIRSAPHVLIAGATGSGKSVCLTGIIASLALNSPESLLLAGVDLKRVEMARFGNLPHLVCPIATDGAAAMRLLDRILAEMGQRFKQMESTGARLATEAGIPPLVLVIDELADLLLGTEAGDKLVRICQLGRAASIHVIMATQRPDSRIVGGLLKAQVPARICFALPSMTDSRVALDQNGAEALLGRGDGLLSLLGQPLRRFQGSLISDQAVFSVLKRWEARGAPQWPEPPDAPAGPTAAEICAAFNSQDSSRLQSMIETVKAREAQGLCRKH